MPLDDGYGVLVGTLVAHERDRPDNQGRWYHVMLTIDVAGARYKAAVDVDSHQSATGVQWKVVPATASGRLFRDEMGRGNARVAAACDEVWFLVAGLPGILVAIITTPLLVHLLNIPVQRIFNVAPIPSISLMPHSAETAICSASTSSGQPSLASRMMALLGAAAVTARMRAMSWPVPTLTLRSGRAAFSAALAAMASGSPSESV